jgi:amino acid transporter
MFQESLLGSLKRIVLGQPIPSHLAHHERLGRVTGLAVLSSDALSSVAYATEEILRTLVLAGTGALALATPVGGVICALLLVVAFSYRQTIFAYPGGGGAYVVARENIGPTAGLVAGAALLIDYVMTVAVSIASGVAAVVSALPAWHLSRPELCLAFLVLIALGNLRGVRESGHIFSVPTYFFLGMMVLLVAVGGVRVLTGTAVPAAVGGVPAETGVAGLTTFLVLRAFANGCTAMTGVEAVSNGVGAFRPPEARNAAATLVVMAFLCVTVFGGVTVLATTYGVRPLHESSAGYETVVSQLARGVFGGRGVAYYAVQAGTTLILILAANTAFAGFPRLASIVAGDRYLPRQFRNQGDRLAFSNGILVLASLAGALMLGFGGDTHALIPLYMVGVFVSFTLSQAGMVLRWRREAGPGWRAHAALNLTGALLTGVVLVVVTVTKFTQGAWLIVVLIPAVVLHFRSVRRHYDAVARQLSLRGYAALPRRSNTVLVPIGGLHRAVVRAFEYARTLGEDVRAVYVDVSPAATAEVRREWAQWGEGIRLEVLPSPYRSLLEPLLEHVDALRRERPEGFITVVLPEFVPKRLWHHLLHNQQALLIKGALLFRRNVVVTSVPFHLRD